MDITASNITDSKNRILLGARDEFIEKGLTGARMDSIAKRAGVNKALLHYYFRSKENLYRETLANVLNHLFRGIHETVLSRKQERSDFRSLVKSFVVLYISTIRNHHEYLPLIMHEMADGGPFLKNLVQDVFRNYSSVIIYIKETLQKEIERKRIRSIEPIHFMLNIIGMCIITFFGKPFIESIHPVLFQTQFTYSDQFFEERINTIVQIMCDGLCLEEGV